MSRNRTDKSVWNKLAKLWKAEQENISPRNDQSPQYLVNPHKIDQLWAFWLICIIYTHSSSQDWGSSIVEPKRTDLKMVLHLNNVFFLVPKKKLKCKWLCPSASSNLYKSTHIERKKLDVEDVMELVKEKHFAFLGTKLPLLHLLLAQMLAQGRQQKVTTSGWSAIRRKLLQSKQQLSLVDNCWL